MTFDLSELDDDDLELLMMQLVFGRYALREHDANRAPEYWYEKFQANMDKVTAELESRGEEQYYQAFVGAIVPYQARFRFRGNPARHRSHVRHREALD